MEIETEVWEILVPYKMGRKNVQVPYHKIWDEFVRNIAGGLTIQKVSKGQWISPSGKLHKELMIPVKIACTESQIRLIADFTLKHYRQEAVFLMRISDKAFIISK
jgi:hypothetical protein